MSNPGQSMASSANLRIAWARLQQGMPQHALDALARIPGGSGVAIDCAVRTRLLAEVELLRDDPGAALRLVRDIDLAGLRGGGASTLIHLAEAEALLALGRYEQALEPAQSALRSSGRIRQLADSMRAGRILARAHLEMGHLDLAAEFIGSAGHALSRSAWSRRFLEGTAPVEQYIIVSTGGNLLVELVRLKMVEADLVLDPRWDPTDEDPEARFFVSESADAFRLVGAHLDGARAELQAARFEAATGSIRTAVAYDASALVDLDAIRHSLRSQTSRLRWSTQFGAAIAQALDHAHHAADHAWMAELIELARIQAVPTRSVAEDARVAEDVGLEAPPRCASAARRGSCVAHRPSRADRPRVRRILRGRSGRLVVRVLGDRRCDLLVACPASGAVSSGRTSMSPESPLGLALAELRSALPLALPDEGFEEFDARIMASPLLIDPAAEEQLAIRLGTALLPERLRRTIARSSTGSEPLRLAIAPSPSLGTVPWSLLGVGSADDDSRSVRLVEGAAWSLVPSAALLIAASTTGSPPHPLPTRLAVLDTVDERSGHEELPAARALAGHLPHALVLGARAWSETPVTKANVIDALRHSGRASSVIFGCHAVPGEEGRPSSGHLVLAGDDPGTDDRLCALDLLRLPIPPRDFPTQVSLQACNTSDIRSSGGGEWLTVAPAFLAAGAITVSTTSFPLLDAQGDPSEDPLIQALVRGDDLLEATRVRQLAGLAAWRAAPSGAIPLEDTAMAWSPHATCAEGRAGTGPVQRRQAVASERTIDFLRRMFKDAPRRSRVISSAHVVMTYVSRETEIVEASLLRALIMVPTVAISMTFGRSPVHRGSERGQRPISAELVGIVRAASDEAALGNGRLEPEHLMRAILDQPGRTRGPTAPPYKTRRHRGATGRDGGRAPTGRDGASPDNGTGCLGEVRTRNPPSSCAVVELSIRGGRRPDDARPRFRSSARAGSLRRAVRQGFSNPLRSRSPP